MANSKSNIYPIQLQGAELNLNKFDAEIKQYSGFNKNNAPFVGGCLSNLFTKNETIEGGTPDNVYIAPNGDVYQVTNNAFYKNGQFLRRLNGIYARQEEMTRPSSIRRQNEVVVRYFAEDIFVTRRYQSTNVNILSYDLYVGANKYSVASSIAVSDIDLNDVEANNITGITFIYSNKVYYVIGTRFNNYLNMYLFVVNEDGSYTTLSRTNFYAANNTISKLVIGYNETHNQVYCVYTNNNSTLEKAASFYTLDTETGLTSLAENINNIASISSEIPSLKWYEFCNYPFNTGYLNLDDAGGFEPNANFKPVLMIKNLYYDNNAIQAQTIYKTEDEVWAIQSFAPDVKKDMGAKSTVTPFFYVKDLSFKVKTSSSAEYNKGIAVHFNSYDISTFGLSFSVTGFSSEGNNKVGHYVFGDIVGFNELEVIFNNNYISGISRTGTLLTEWNAKIEPGSIFTGRNCIYYKLNGKYYKIYLVDNAYAIIKRVENQLVINQAFTPNSYDLERNVFLRYAPSFNMCITSYYDNERRKTFIYDLTDVNDNKKIAAAINEYSPQDNSSILLNPVTFYNANNYSIKLLYQNGYEIVNVYYNDITEDLKYSYSYRNGNIYYNPDLIGLPFPIDTNGNVQYSPSLFAEFFSSFGNDVFIKEGDNAYQLSKYNNQPIMSFYLGTLVEGLSEVFVLQGQYYGIINNQIFSLQFYNGVVSSQTSVVSVQGLQFCGNTPYEALFYSKTNRCLYSFTGANILNSKQFVDKIGVVIDYEYNPATQSIFLLTDIGVLVYSLFGTYQIDIPNAKKMYLLNNGVCIVDEDNNFRYVRYYKEDAEDGFIKQNIKLDTMFYGINNETVTINDCLYVRLFSEEHEEGDLEVSATTLSLKGRMTEKTTFKIKASDWDEETHSIYLRYQPKEQRGLGISFKIESPFKIASLSVGSKADAILVDKVSKGAINKPFTNNSAITEW